MSTGFTPVEIFCNTPPQNFLSSFITFPPNEENLTHQEKLVLVEENLFRNAANRKAKHDLNSADHNFEEGSEILLKTHYHSDALQGVMKKFFRLYDGPYILGKPVGKNAFEVVHPDSGELKGVYNVNQFRPFRRIENG